MTRLATRLRTFAAIGPANGARVLGYRLALKLGIHPAQRIWAELPQEGPFFEESAVPPRELSAPRIWRDQGLLFGAYPLAVTDAPPAWTKDPLPEPCAQGPAPDVLLPWWQIGDFEGSDIKRIWELSRFDWAMAFAQQARVGDADALKRLNYWITDWAKANPAYYGPNWKCAQEASIRLLHLSIAALILGTEKQVPEPLQRLIDAHVRRIAPTLSYARAQDNNHATSEAAALFVAGAWQSLSNVKGGSALVSKGRELLERSVARLFAPDGSFSQYSLNYHRLALDSLSIAEVWRRRAALPEFTAIWRGRAAAASDWLRVLIDPASGDAPNLGANDGANLLPLADAGYRDYRPSAQLASVLFRDARALPPGPWDDALQWLSITAPDLVLPVPQQAIFDHGGYAVLRRNGVMALLRYPRFRFRPSQADSLHVDLWRNGDNLLRDGGSYSYNTDERWIDYFGGVQSHNSIEFDGRPQMPRLSRFLLGDWLETETSGPTESGFAASYRHRAGWMHLREVRLSEELKVIDRVDGFRREARLRWRLAPGEWKIEGHSVTNGSDRLTISADVPIQSLALVTGWESRHYLEKTELPVLEAVITQAGQIVSEYRWTL